MARTKKKGRALKVTRPKPTIYGNCDSWNFIVGKKPGAYSGKGCSRGPLQARNWHLIHSFSTKYGRNCWDNMWAICGCRKDKPETSRMVVMVGFDMPQTSSEAQEFYPKV